MEATLHITTEIVEEQEATVPEEDGGEATASDEDGEVVGSDEDGGEVFVSGVEQVAVHAHGDDISVHVASEIYLATGTDSIQLTVKSHLDLEVSVQFLEGICSICLSTPFSSLKNNPMYTALVLFCATLVSAVWYLLASPLIMQLVSRCEEERVKHSHNWILNWSIYVFSMLLSFISNPSWLWVGFVILGLPQLHWQWQFTVKVGQALLFAKLAVKILKATMEAPFMQEPILFVKEKINRMQLAVEKCYLHYFDL
jgi:hypothetical protein